MNVNKKFYKNVQDLKKLWFAFWKQKKHLIIESKSLVSEDPSLLWVNSGVAGLKDYFLGIAKAPQKRLANIQKSVRTNDIEQIGFTNRHLSFFEMMGNFALNDYHKKEAISFAWEFLTSPKWLAINPNKLYITIFKDDKEALEICEKDLKIARSHIIFGDKTTNFWDLGVGPCGPNLEIFYDLGKDFDIKNQGIELLKNNIENDRYLEIWNIVFSEWINLGNKNYQKAKHKNIDTGAGLERILTVLQRKNNCFETELFYPIIQKLETFTNLKFILKPNHKLNQKQLLENRHMKIIADHIRSIVFLLSDLFEAQISWDFNNKQGYIIKKLIRKATLNSFLLKIKKPILNELAILIINQMNSFYPNLKKHQKAVINIILQEEKRFLNLLANNSLLKDLFLIKPNSKIKGEVLFQLVTEVGIPLFYLEIIAKEKKLKLDILEFSKLWKNHQIKSHKKSNIFVKDWQILTFDSKIKTEFLDHTSKFKSKVLALFVDKKKVSIIDNKQKEAWIITEQSPFYPEKGGQIFDIGKIFNKDFEGDVDQVYLNNDNQIIHHVIYQGKLKNKDLVTLEINWKRREKITFNHSATHLLHGVLRKQFGNNLKQNGSYLDDKGFRFDFFCLNDDLIYKDFEIIEDKVNEEIRKQMEAKVSLVTKEEATKAGALSFFHVDKFIDKKVRIVQFGNISSELCGGTHVKNTKEIEKFMITQFTKIGKNNYRILAITKKKTIYHFLQKKLEIRNEFLKSYQEVYQQVIESEEGAKLNQEFKKYHHFFLLNNYFWLKLVNLIKHQKLTIQKTKILLKAKNYMISPNDFITISDTTLLFHVLNPKLVIEKNPIIFLRNVFDNYKKTPQLIICLLIKSKTNQWSFIFKDNSQSTIDWEKCFKKEANFPINFGSNQNKLQGILKVENPETFKKLILKKLT